MDPKIQPEAAPAAEEPVAEPADVEPEIDPAQVVDATPVSVYKPGDPAVTASKGSARRRSKEDMLQRPEWLPSDWRMDVRKRSSGKTAGEYDRYFFSPTGKRLRSKNEVMRFIKDQQAGSGNADSPASGSGESAKKPKTESPTEEKASADVEEGTIETNDNQVS